MAEFSELREKVPIERVFTEMLGVTDFRRSGPKQLIGTCPACGSKSLKITPSMGLSNCFNCPLGGDIITAVARARKLSATDAGNAIAAHFKVAAAKPNGKAASTAPPFDPAEYQKRLDPEHESLVPLKVSSGIVREFGGGYAQKGKLGARLALPLIEGDRIVSFFGVAVDDAEPRIKFARDEDKLGIFNAQRIGEGEMLTVCRDPLAVLRAAANGDTQVVAVFTDYTPDALRRIAALMETNKIEAAELF